MLSYRPVMLCVALLLPSVGELAAQTQKVVMVHGAGSTGATWAVGASYLQSTISGLPPVQRPTISQSVSLYGQGVLLADSVLQNMPADQSVMVAHSNGGLMSRHATHYFSPLGIVTVGTGHAGVVIATQVGPIVETLNWNTFLLADVLLLSAYPLAFGYTGMSPVFYVQASAYAAALAAEGAYVYGLTQIQKFEPFLADNQPGSAFVQQLPTGGANRYSISVSDASGASPWSLAMSPSAAQTAMYLGTGMGYALFWSALELYDYLDWSSPDAMYAYMYIGSAVSLANLVVDVPGHWCVLVGGGFCQVSDGFVTTGNQAYPGGVNENLSGPAHTKEPEDPFVLQRIGSRVASILGL